MTWQAGAGAARTFTTPLPKSAPAPAYLLHNVVRDRAVRLAGAASDVGCLVLRSRCDPIAKSTAFARQVPHAVGVNFSRERKVQPLLDLSFLEDHMLTRHRVVLAEADLIGRRPGVLLGHIEEAGARGAEQLDFRRVRFGQCARRPCFSGTFSAAAL
jgi:hypothetical protein